LDGRTFEVVQTITTLGRVHHWKLWHDGTKNKDFIIGEDFNWNYQGSGIYAFDPSENNVLIGGMSNGDFEGNPYVTTPAADGSFIAVTVPAPDPAYRDKIPGVLAKVDPKSWKIVGITPMVDPLWAEVSLDNKYAYVTSGGESRVHKINLQTMQDEGYVATGPGPWGARISYDQTKLYTADKGEGPGYNQQGHTTTIIDLDTLGVVKVVDIGVTTDHAILSPDGGEVWFTSNADHAIYVLDTKTDTIATIVKDPADGDIHGGVFVQYKDDGKGNVVGEVVSDYSGLHGTALAAQRQYVAEPTLTIAINRTGFLQKSVMATAGQATRLTIKNVSGTYAGKATFESKDLGIDQITLAPGESKEIRWTPPAQPISLKATTNLAPNKELAVTVMAAQPKATAAPVTTGPRQIVIHAKGFVFDVQSVDVKAGETVAFVVSNGDDEKHNLVGTGGPISLLSPDVASGATVIYQWTAPSTPGQFTVLCAYHPQMTFKLTVQ
jgi:plastocyanin/DNA-binding beta-propeller fold protein YncE